MYDPVNLRSQYREMEHGKAQLAGIRAAIEAADAHKDVPYQIYFRTQFCEESVFYGDDLDMVVMFPELQPGITACFGTVMIMCYGCISGCWRIVSYFTRYPWKTV